MSEIVPHVNLKEGAVTRRGYGAAVTAIEYGKGGTRPTILLQDGRSGVGCCLACIDPPCIQSHQFSAAGSTILADFPQYPNTELCPTGAITIDAESQRAQVNALTCIGCGLCVVRCPYGAIHLQHDGKAVVSNDDTNSLTNAGVPLTVLDNPKRTGVLGPTEPFQSK